jgi:hypothetical protein
MTTQLGGTKNVTGYGTMSAAARKTLIDKFRERADLVDSKYNPASVMAASTLMAATSVSEVERPAEATFSTRAPLFYLPEGAPMKARLILNFILVNSMTNDNSNDLVKWTTVLGSFVANLFLRPCEKTMLSKFTPVMLDGAVMVGICDRHIRAYDALTETKPAPTTPTLEGAYATLVSRVLGLIDEDHTTTPDLLPFPMPKREVLDVFMYDTDDLSWYALLGVIMFAIIKVPVSGVSDAFSRNRALAVMQKYGLTDQTAPNMSPDVYGPSLFAYSKFHLLWRRLPELRRDLVIHVVEVMAGSGSAEVEAVFTTVRLMRWGDLTHMSLITQMLERHPWVTAVEDWTGELSAYKTAVKQIIELCPPRYAKNGQMLRSADGEIMRDTTLAAYLKVIWGDTKTVAEAKNLRLLTYLAREDLRTIQPSLDQYVVSTTFPDARTQFVELADLYLQMQNEIVEDQGQAGSVHQGNE